MSALLSCFFTLLSLNPHSAHLYIIESPISFSGSMSPPQHAHFITSKWHKDEILFLSLVFLAIDTICIFLFLFLLLFRWWRGISGMLFPTIPFRLYIKIIVTNEDLSHFAHIHPKFTHPLYIKGNSFIHSIRGWQSEIWYISIITKRITTVSY